MLSLRYVTALVFRFLLLAFSCCYSSAKASNKPIREFDAIVTTSCGKIGGVLDTNLPFSYAFRGIPFSTPPTGSLRWKPPVPLPSNGFASIF